MLAFAPEPRSVYFMGVVFPTFPKHADSNLYWLTIVRRGKTGGERSRKMRAMAHPLRTTPVKSSETVSTDPG